MNVVVVFGLVVNLVVVVVVVVVSALVVAAVGVASTSNRLRRSRPMFLAIRSMALARGLDFWYRGLLCFRTAIQLSD